MLRTVSRPTLLHLAMTRLAGGPAPPATYESEIVTKELGYQKIREYERKLAAELKHVNSLPGLSSDEYKPSLEPGSINLRSMHPPYYSPQLRGQEQSVTEAAWAKIALWQQKISDAKGTNRVDLIGDLINEFKLLIIMSGDPLLDAGYVGNSPTMHILRYHGIVRGIEGVMVLNTEGDEELEDDFIEHSEFTWMPQGWAGGHFIGGWRQIIEAHNTGELVQILEQCGLSSKMKGCYYDRNSPEVLH